MLRFLAKQNACYLADEMGVGKSPQFVEAARRLGAQGILCVCPASVVIKNAREFDAWYPELKLSGKKILSCANKEVVAKIPFSSVVVISYERARGSALPALMKRKWDLIIYDEAHYLKSTTAKRTIVCLNKLWPLAKRVIAVSGTPTPNGVIDGYSLFNKIAPAIFPNKYKYGFRYTNAEKNWFTGKYEFKGGRNLPELRSILFENFMVRRLQKDVLSELPPILFSKIPVRINAAKEWNLPNYQVDILKKAIEDGAPIHLSDHISTIRAGIGLSKILPVWEHCRDILESGEKKLIIFAYHKSVIAALKGAAVSAKYDCMVIDGSKSTSERSRIVEQFQSEAIQTQQVLIVQIVAGGIGIDLTAAKVCVFAELDWVPSNIAQCYKRLHRMGQEGRVQVHYIIAADTLDDQISGALISKARIINQILEPIKEEPAMEAQA